MNVSAFLGAVNRILQFEQTSDNELAKNPIRIARNQDNACQICTNALPDRYASNLESPAAPPLDSRIAESMMPAML